MYMFSQRAVQNKYVLQQKSIGTDNLVFFNA